MKKFLAVLSAVVVLVMIINNVHYRLGWFIDFNPGKEVTAFVKAEDKKIYINKGEGYEPFEIKGVNMGSGEPGQWSTDFAIDKDTYIRWFGYIKEMGANTIRIYTVQQDVFMKPCTNTTKAIMILFM